MTAKSESTHHDGYEWVRQKCPICEVPPTRFLGRRGGAAHREGLGVTAEIWSCGSCGLIFPDPMPHPTGGIGQHYSMEADEYFAEHDPQGKIGNARRIVQDAGHLIGGTGRLLDVGVGRGETILAAKELGWETEGVEPSATFADYAEKMTGAKIWRIAVENADIPAGSFDVVILAAVLEHLYDPDRVIAKASSVLRSGGVLYVDVPNEHGLYFKAGNLYQKFRRRDWCVNLAPTFSPYHVFGFGVGSIHRLLKKHSLKPVRCEVVGGTSMVSGRGGLAGSLERIAARAVTKLSEFGRMGTYIETWAVKK